MDTSAPESRRYCSPQLVFGLIVIAIGVLFTLDNLGISDAGTYLRFWPVGVIVIGLVKLWQSRGSSGGVAGFLFILAGLWLLSDSLDIIHISIRDVWPLVLVLVGASMVWRGTQVGRARTTDNNAWLSAVAILGGVTRGNNAPAFRGGDLTAVMGGCEIDLRQASIDGEAVIDVFAMWGGIDIRVPEDWTVVGRVVPLLGGFEDKTRPPKSATAHKLVVRGLAIMGGIEVKN